MYLSIYIIERKLVSIILEAARRRFGEGAEIWLFGSRVRDDARGGDIDLLVALTASIPAALSSSLAFEADTSRRSPRKHPTIAGESGLR